MNSKFKQAIAFLAAASAAMTSCVDDLNLEGLSQSKLEEVYFTASIAEQDFFGMRYAANTRSAIDEQMRVKSGFYDLPFDGRNDLKLSVSTLDGMFSKATPIPEEGDANATTRGMLLTELQQQPMSVFEVGKLSDGKTVTGEPYTAYTVDGATWGGSHIEHNSNTVSRTLYAVYPSSKSYTINGDSRTLAYTTPENATDQSDLLYATKEQSLGAENKDFVHLTFDHLLTAVRFKIGSQQLPLSVIKSISIHGIITSGTYNFTNNTWNLSSEKGKVSCDLDFNVTGVENTIINGGENTFMLLPQQLTPASRVTIVYEDYNEDDAASQGIKTLTASLATADTPAWEAGQCITYTLMDHDENNEYILDVELPQDFSPEGGKQAVNVLSYRHVEDKRIPMRWIVQSYSSDGGRTWMSGGASNVPKGMSITPTEGSGSEKTPITITLVASDTVFAPHRDFLRYKTPLGCNGETFDLSTHDYLNKPCARTTANCYVVDAPGKYRFPTAYGNAIVNGWTNSDAFTDKAGYENSTKKNFMTHTGREITAPMIRNNGITLSRATLVWEDVQDLINPNSIKLVDDGNAIEFEILADDIDQGNAVIAAMDGDNVAWSWHIWVTDEKASLAEPISDKNGFGGDVDFMPLTLGWCSNAKARGAIGREAAVRIVMPERPTKRSSFVIRQNSTPSYDIMENSDGNATYYNWGRKDPFPGAEGTYVTTGSTNADDLPKNFYQTGVDGAALGLHAELHTEYSSDWKSLLAEGILVGVDGFLTGITIGKIVNALKDMNAYKHGAEQLIEGNEVTIKEESSGVYKLKNYSPGKDPNSLGNILLTDREMAEHCIDVASDTEAQFVGCFKNGKECPIRKWFGAPYPADKLEVAWTDKYGYGLFVRNENNVPVAFIEIGAWDATQGVDYEFIKHAVIANPRVTAYLFMGDYSGVLMHTAHQVLSNEFSVGSAFSHSSLFKGGTDWCKQMTSHGVPINYGIQHPNVLMRDPISWINYDGVGNLWNAAQTKYSDKEEAVVKSIYDPCPAGYCVPSQKDMSGLDDGSTDRKYRGGTERITTSGYAILFPGLGVRNFWGANQPGSAATNNINEQIQFNGAQGFFWTSSPAINKDEDGEKGAYAVNFRGSSSYNDYGEKGVQLTPRVINDLKLQTSFALPIRPVREKR